MSEKVTLDTVDKELFDRIWSIYTEMGTEERHFNELQSTYRALASTWLLATFAAVGFLLSEKLTSCPIDKLLIIVAIGIMSSIGIMLMWNLDLKVYHPLLAAAFRQGRILEKQYSWLPQMRTNMLHRMNEKGVIPRVIWFYIIGSTIPLAISGAALVTWSIHKGVLFSLTWGGLFLVLIITVGKYLYDHKGSESHYHNAIAGIEMADGLRSES
jgi:hypothetical protein